MKVTYLLLALVSLAFVPVMTPWAVTSQTSLALAQAEKALEAFDSGETELGRQHILAAESHADVALRDQTGQIRTKLKSSVNQLKNAGLQAKKGNRNAASASTVKAIKALGDVELSGRSQ